jgi:hypothetical protein
MYRMGADSVITLTSSKNAGVAPDWFNHSTLFGASLNPYNKQVKRPIPKQKWAQRGAFAATFLMLALCALVLIVALPRATRQAAASSEARQIRLDLASAETATSALVARQASSKTKLPRRS